MSAINQALSDLAKKNGSPLTAIEQAQVMPVKQRPVLPWVVHFSLLAQQWLQAAR